MKWIFMFVNYALSDYSMIIFEFTNYLNIDIVKNYINSI